jgi:hypothetical protein
MAVRTIGNLVTLFRAKTNLTETQIPEEGALEMVNLGFDMLAQDTGGLTALIKTDLIAGEERYFLPDYVLKVNEVHLALGANERPIILTKMEPRYLQRMANSKESGTPKVFAFSPSQMHDDDRGRPTLRIQPAPSGDTVDGLWAYVQRIPDRKTSLSQEIDLGDGAAATAAVSWACWYAVSNPALKQAFFAEYIQAKASYNRSRGVRMPVYSFRPGYNIGR